MKHGHFNDKALPDMLSNVSESPELYKLNSFGYRCPDWSPMPHGKKNVVILGRSAKVWPRTNTGYTSCPNTTRIG